MVQVTKPLSVLLLIVLSSFTTDIGICEIINQECLNVCTCGFPPSVNNTLIVNCANKNISDLPKDWPEHGAHLIVTFAHNSLHRLTKIASSEAHTIAISFKNNSISTIDPNIFADAINVKYLDLSYNLLKSEDIHPEIFKGRYKDKEYEPIGLLELDLSNNRISSIDEKLFEHMQNLTTLDLSNNLFTIIDDSTWIAITSLKNLKQLTLSNISISEFPKFDLGRHLNGITKLDLSNNNFVSVPTELGSIAESLEILLLDGNLIEELNDESFMGLEKLRELRLSNLENLKTINHNTFSNLEHLRTLYLNNNPHLTIIHENAFGIMENWPPIIELYINDNSLNELSPSLLDWTIISVVKFQGNNWKCPCEISPPCVCHAHDLSRKLNVHEPPHASHFNRNVLIIIPILLLFVSGVFSWRILIKYRSSRLINHTYPVLYTAIPTPRMH